MENGLISVVVPCYNVEKFLKDCVDSLDAQTYKHFEVIFVDDGSTDGTLSVLQQLCTGKSNYKIISKQNGGVSSARNVGIAACNGEFVQFLDSDDMLVPNYFQVMVENIEDQDVCICKFKNCKEKTKFNPKALPKVKKEMLFDNKVDILCQYLSRNLFKLGMANKMYKFEIVQKMDNFPNCFNTEVSYGEDTLFISNYLNLCNRAKWLDFKGYYYRSRKGSLVHSAFSEQKLSVFKTHENNLKTFANDEKILTYAQSFCCMSCMEMLIRIYISKYQNPTLVKDLYSNLKVYLPSLKKSKRCPWYVRKLIPIAAPFMKAFLRIKTHS